MSLLEIRILALKNNLSMTELSIKLGLERRTFYNKIKTQDEKTIKTIKKFFKI